MNLATKLATHAQITLTHAREKVLVVKDTTGVRVDQTVLSAQKIILC